MRIVFPLLVVLGLACACGKRSQTTEPPAPPVSPGPGTPAVAAPPSESPPAGSPDATAPAPPVEPSPLVAPTASADASAATPPSTPAAPADPVAAPLAEIGTAIGCPSPDSPHRTWCIAVDGWASGTLPELPEGGHAWLGLTVAVASGQPVLDALIDKVSLGALAVRNEGGSAVAMITSITPDNDDESRMMAEAIFNLALLLKGRAQTVPIGNDLLGYVGGLPAGASHPVTPGELGWRFEGEAVAEVRRVGDFWVAVETPREGPPGIFVSIYTDRLEGH